MKICIHLMFFCKQKSQFHKNYLGAEKYQKYRYYQHFFSTLILDIFSISQQPTGYWYLIKYSWHLVVPGTSHGILPDVKRIDYRFKNNKTDIFLPSFWCVIQKQLQVGMWTTVSWSNLLSASDCFVTLVLHIYLTCLLYEDLGCATQTFQTGCHFENLYHHYILAPDLWVCTIMIYILYIFYQIL